MASSASRLERRRLSAEDLQDFFDAHLAQSRAPELITMTHVFVDPDRRGDRTLDDAAEMLAELQAMDDATEVAATIGDPLMLQTYYPERSQSEMARAPPASRHIGSTGRARDRASAGSRIGARSMSLARGRSSSLDGSADG